MSTLFSVLRLQKDQNYFNLTQNYYRKNTRQLLRVKLFKLRQCDFNYKT